MKFALLYEIPVPRPWNERSEYEAYRQAIEQIELADRLGFHSAWAVEHHFLEEYSHCSAPEVLFGYLAARTRRIRLGHGVRLLPSPYNHPAKLAAQAAVLDLLCDGRLEFGTGRSATRLEIEGFEVDPLTTREQWAEGLAYLVEAWTQQEARFEGATWKLVPRKVLPKPLQKPHPPLWGATSNEEGHYAVGRQGIGLLSFTVGIGPEDLKPRIEAYRKGIAAARALGGVSPVVNECAGAFTMAHCAPTLEEAEADARESFPWYVRRACEQIATLPLWLQGKEMGSYEYTKLFMGLDLSGLGIEFLRDSGACLLGTPERCAEIAARYQAVGCELLLLLVQPYKIPHEKVLRSIELLGTEVLPRFHSQEK